MKISGKEALDGTPAPISSFDNPTSNPSGFSRGVLLFLNNLCVLEYIYAINNRKENMKIITRQVFILISLAALFLGASTSITQAKNDKIPSGYIIDQRSDETTGNRLALWNNIAYYTPMGQEFVPDHPKLVGVDIYVTYSGTNTGTLNLKIRESNIYGPILASRDFTTDVKFRGWRHFSFLPPVELQPGSIYVIEVEPVGQNYGWGTLSDGRCWQDTYSRGDWILWGYHYSPDCHNDLAFRTYTLKSGK